MRIAKTVQAIEAGVDPRASRILDRSIPLDQTFVEQMLSLTQFTWHGRKPKTATSLDILSLLVELQRRGARVQIDEYQNRTPWKILSGQQHVGSTKRYGPIVGLVSNQEHLSFSIRIKDESLHVASGQPEENSHRSYMMVDYDGSWHQGWDGFDWDKTDEEVAYLNRHGLLVGDTVAFRDYVHTNRRQSIFGAPYMLLKLILMRIEDELIFRKEEKKNSKDIERFAGDGEPPRCYCVATGPSQSISAPTFKVALNGLSCRGTYESLSYRDCCAMIALLERVLRPQVQFVVRADEAAFYRHGLAGDFVANWITGTSWVRESVDSSYIMLGDTLSLSYHLGEKEKRVAA